MGSIAPICDVRGMNGDATKEEPAHEFPAEGWIAKLRNQEMGDLTGDGPLRESKAWLRAIFDSVPSGIIIVDPERHVIIDINPAAARMFGKERKNIIGSCVTNISVPRRSASVPSLTSERRWITPNGCFLRPMGMPAP